jgi:hypothetical integral membrane protein (TIGR02206 family)
MLESFYTDQHQDVTGTFQHWGNVITYFILGFLILYQGKYKWNDQQKRTNIVMICAIIYGLQLFKTCFRIYLGNFNHEVDLPLHVCNILPLAMSLVYYYKSKLGFGIFFFWIMCGTLQANVTPTLWDAFPHYESLRYWATHSLLPFIAVYGLVVLGYKINFRYLIISWLCMTAGAYMMYHVNNLLGSNYWFVNAKPNAKTIYDLLGPWPTYMFQLFPVVLVIFTIMFLIIRLIKWVATNFGGYKEPKFVE